MIGTFPEIFNKAEVRTVFKKGDQKPKIDYHLISTLSDFSKIFEKLIICNWITLCNANFKFTYRFSEKPQRSYHVLLKIIETLEAKSIMGQKVGIIYMDLSKACDSRNCQFLN